MASINLTFNSYRDMLIFCKTVTQSCMYIPSEPTTEPSPEPEPEIPTNINYAQLDELSNNINNFVDDISNDLEFDTPQPQFDHIGKRMKQILMLFWNHKLFNYNMVRDNLGKTPSGNYIHYQLVLDQMERKNLIIKVDDEQYFVNPKVIDQKPHWLKLELK